MVADRDLEPRRLVEALGEQAGLQRPGDVLVLRTDGVEDARDPDGQRFGEERVIAAVGAAAAGGASADAVAEAIDAAVAAHERGGPRRDDRAVVVLRVGG